MAPVPDGCPNIGVPVVCWVLLAGWPKSDVDVVVCGCWEPLAGCPNSEVDGCCCVVWGCDEGVVPATAGGLPPKIDPLGLF